MHSRTQTNNAFGNSRPTMTRSSPLRPGVYVPPSRRQGVVINDTNFPTLGGVSVPKKTPYADPARPCLLKVVSDRAIADAKTEAATQRTTVEKTEPAMVPPPVGSYLKRVAERQAREARMRDERDMALLCDSSSFFRALMNHRPPTTEAGWLDARSSTPEAWASTSPDEDWDEEPDEYQSGDSDAA